MPLPPALAAKLAKRGILQQSDTNTSKSSNRPAVAEGIRIMRYILICIVFFHLIARLFEGRNAESKTQDENEVVKEKEDSLEDVKFKVIKYLFFHYMYGGL